MKAVIHARLGPDEQELLRELKQVTGWSDSELVRRGLRLVQRDLAPRRSALDLAGRSAGKFAGGPVGLSTDAKHLEGFGR